MTQHNIIGGQWNLIATPTDKNFCPINLYANITDKGSGSFFADRGSALQAMNDNANSAIFDQRSILFGKLVGDKVAIAANPSSLTLTGTIDGSAMSGSYTDRRGGGTWAAQKRPPVTGRYTGTLKSSVNRSAKEILVTLNISQAEDFSIRGTAVVENCARFASLKFDADSRVVGGAIHLVDSTKGATINLIPNDDGKLNLDSSFYVHYRFEDAAGAGDLGTGIARKQ
jgi:hypothetical protein